jgi:pSer/pThr/pTyr-binding forkhead associated (FHA) protein
MWVLQRSDPDGPPLIVRLPAGASRTVGRAPQADILVDVALVSRLHCRLEVGAEGVDVIDLESTNGTYVNDVRVGRATLTPGDRLRIGRVEMKIGRDSPIV